MMRMRSKKGKALRTMLSRQQAQECGRHSAPGYVCTPNVRYTNVSSAWILGKAKECAGGGQVFSLPGHLSRPGCDDEGKEEVRCSVKVIQT